MNRVHQVNIPQQPAAIRLLNALSARWAHTLFQGRRAVACARWDCIPRMLVRPAARYAPPIFTATQRARRRASAVPRAEWVRLQARHQ